MMVKVLKILEDIKFEIICMEELMLGAWFIIVHV